MGQRLAIAANKCELPPEQHTVSLAAAEKYAASIGAVLFQTSAKENVCISDLFYEVGRRLCVTRFLEEEASSLSLPPMPGVSPERQRCQC